MAKTGDFPTIQRWLAANLSRRREQKGWTQQQAAEHMGLDPKHVQKIEAGTLNPTLRTLVAIAGALGISAASFSPRLERHHLGGPSVGLGSEAAPEAAIAGCRTNAAATQVSVWKS